MNPFKLSRRSAWGVALLGGVALTGCGGGGGGGATPPVATEVELRATPDGTDRILVALTSVTGKGAAVLQFDLVFDPGTTTPGTPIVTGAVPLPDIDAAIVEPGRIRIMAGDARNSSPQELRDGHLLTVAIAPRPNGTGPAGPVEVLLTDPILASGAGEPIATRPGPIPVRLR